MDITFLVGNGFDIACGIDTSYKAFYNWYLKQPSSSVFIKDLKENIENNWENWSDFEIGLEQYSQYFGANNIEGFFECYDDAQKSIVEFLNMQTSKINFNMLDEKQIREFINNIIYFYEDLPSVIEKRTYSNEKHVNYHFISFNYTQILNKLLEMVSKLPHPLDDVMNNKKIYLPAINIHGTLTKSPLLGVSEECQITNKELLKLSYFSQIMIKPNAAKAIGESWYDEAIELIETSDAICIFGMSLGESDSFLWEKIITRLRISLNCILIIFWYTDNPPSNISTYNFIVEKNKVQDIILKYADLYPEEINKLKERIHIVFNTKRVLQINLSQTNINDDKKLLKV